MRYFQIFYIRCHWSYLLLMHPDDLNAIWLCHECKSTFVFHSDVDEHKITTQHSQIEKYDLVSGELLA